jgi:hypothetical protein
MSSNSRWSNACPGKSRRQQTLIACKSKHYGRRRLPRYRAQWPIAVSRGEENHFPPPLCFISASVIRVNPRPSVVETLHRSLSVRRKVARSLQKSIWTVRHCGRDSLYLLMWMLMLISTRPLRDLNVAKAKRSANRVPIQLRAAAKGWGACNPGFAKETNCL